MPDRVALQRVRPHALDERPLALEQAAHAREVFGERRFGELRLDPLELRLEGGALRACRPDRRPDARAAALDELGQVRDARAAAYRHAAGIGRLVAREHPQQRALAAAVGADQPDASARAELEVGAVENAPPAEGLHDGAEGERGSGGNGDGHCRR